MEIRRLDPTDAELAARAHAVIELAHRADIPEHPPLTLRSFVEAMTTPPPGAEVRGHIALDGDEVLGCTTVYLPMASNPHYAEAELDVHPGHRRRGVGTALLGALLDSVRSLGRTELVVLARGAVSGGPKRSEAGPRFLEHHGFTPALTEVDRRLDLASTDPATERLLWKRAKEQSSEDYEFVSWTGRTPEAHLERLCRLDSMIFDEVPLGDVNLQRREVDADEQRAKDDRNEALGMLAVRTIAVHRPSGEPAANTVIYVREGEAHAQQAITITAPGHRGHRLGILVKLANLAQLREHCGGVAIVWAGNADTNVRMVAINERLGFKAVDARLSYKRELRA